MFGKFIAFVSVLIRANILPARQNLSYICVCVCVWVSKAIVEFSPDGQTVLFTFLCPIMARAKLRIDLSFCLDCQCGFCFCQNGNSDWSLNLCWVSLRWLWLLHGLREGGIQVSAGMQIAVGVCGWHDSQFSLEKIRELLRYEIQINFFLALSPPRPFCG